MYLVFSYPEFSFPIFTFPVRPVRAVFEWNSGYICPGALVPALGPFVT